MPFKSFRMENGLSDFSSAFDYHQVILYRLTENNLLSSLFSRVDHFFFYLLVFIGTCALAFASILLKRSGGEAKRKKDSHSTLALKVKYLFWVILIMYGLLRYTISFCTQAKNFSIRPFLLYHLSGVLDYTEFLDNVVVVVAVFIISQPRYRYPYVGFYC